MTTDYSKGKNSQGDKSNSYQAASTNKSDNTYRNPNAPTQGGFSTPGGGNLGQPQKDKTDKTQATKTPQTNKQSSNAWGTGSINKTDKDSHR